MKKNTNRRASFFSINTTTENNRERTQSIPNNRAAEENDDSKSSNIPPLFKTNVWRIITLNNDSNTQGSLHRLLQQPAHANDPAKLLFILKELKKSQNRFEVIKSYLEEEKTNFDITTLNNCLNLIQDDQQKLKLTQLWIKKADNNNPLQQIIDLLDFPLTTNALANFLLKETDHPLTLDELGIITNNTKEEDKRFELIKSWLEKTENNSQIEAALNTEISANNQVKILNYWLENDNNKLNSDKLRTILNIVKKGAQFEIAKSWLRTAENNSQITEVLTSRIDDKTKIRVINFWFRNNNPTLEEMTNILSYIRNGSERSNAAKLWIDNNLKNFHPVDMKDILSNVVDKQWKYDEIKRWLQQNISITSLELLDILNSSSEYRFNLAKLWLEKTNNNLDTEELKSILRVIDNSVSFINLWLQKGENNISSEELPEFLESYDDRNKLSIVDIWLKKENNILRPEEASSVLQSFREQSIKISFARSWVNKRQNHSNFDNLENFLKLPQISDIDKYPLIKICLTQQQHNNINSQQLEILLELIHDNSKKDELRSLQRKNYIPSDYPIDDLQQTNIDSAIEDPLDNYQKYETTKSLLTGQRQINPKLIPLKDFFELQQDRKNFHDIQTLFNLSWKSKEYRLQLKKNIITILKQENGRYDDTIKQLEKYLTKEGVEETNTADLAKRLASILPTINDINLRRQITEILCIEGNIELVETKDFIELTENALLQDSLKKILSQEDEKYGIINLKGLLDKTQNNDFLEKTVIKLLFPNNNISGEELLETVKLIADDKQKFELIELWLNKQENNLTSTSLQDFLKSIKDDSINYKLIESWLNKKHNRVLLDESLITSGSNGILDPILDQMSEIEKDVEDKEFTENDLDLKELETIIQRLDYPETKADLLELWLRKSSKKTLSNFIEIIKGPNILHDLLETPFKDLTISDISESFINYFITGENFDFTTLCTKIFPSDTSKQIELFESLIEQISNQTILEGNLKGFPYINFVNKNLITKESENFINNLPIDDEQKLHLTNFLSKQIGSNKDIKTTTKPSPTTTSSTQKTENMVSTTQMVPAT